jgi:hypothetical protein
MSLADRWQAWTSKSSGCGHASRSWGIVYTPGGWLEEGCSRVDSRFCNWSHASSDRGLSIITSRKKLGLGILVTKGCDELQSRVFGNAALRSESDSRGRQRRTQHFRDSGVNALEGHLSCRRRSPRFRRFLSGTGETNFRSA